MTRLIDILCCTECRGPVSLDRDRLDCAGCKRRYEVRGSVPVMLPAGSAFALNESEVMVRAGYYDLVQRLFDSLFADQVILDIGAGNRNVDDPRIIRTDVVVTPHVDVAADAHRLPFRDGTIDFVHASAVFEHLKHPFVAAEEICRVLKPGGYVYADCNFVYPFHGYPAVYFNASMEGMRAWFSGFEELAVIVAPWQMPSFAVEALLAEYLKYFQAETPIEKDFVQALKALDRFPIRDFDARFRHEDAARIAAGVTYFGSRPADGSPLLPQPILEAYSRDPALRERYPNPAALTKWRSGIEVDGLLTWAQTEGRATDPGIRDYLEILEPFVKSLR